MKEGFGVFNYNSGDKYEGDYKNDVSSGHGKLTWSEGVYEGAFKNNKENGFGRKEWTSGQRKG